MSADLPFLSMCHLVFQSLLHEGLRAVTLLVWQMASRRQEMEAARKLRATPGIGTASLLLHSVALSSHRAHSDPRGWK